MAAAVFSSVLSFSQGIERDVIASSGDYFEVGSVSLSWTLGEVMEENYSTNGAGELSQGFHQRPLNRSLILAFIFGFLSDTEAVEETDLSTNEVIKMEDAGFSFRVYPNPAKSFINIEWSGPWEDDLEFEMKDMLGRQLLIGELLNEFTHLDISSLQSGMYILHIQSKKLNNLKTIKINKID